MDKLNQAFEALSSANKLLKDELEADDGENEDDDGEGSMVLV